MPAASRKLSAKPPSSPAAAASASRHKATAPPPLRSCDDDDDDFVSPPSASHARPLKPCNGNGGAASRRPCKKLKPSYSSSAKENRFVACVPGPAEKVAAAAVPRSAETLATGSRVSSGAPEGRQTIGGEISGLSRYESDDSKLGRNVREVSERYGNFKSNSSPSPSFSELCVSVMGPLCGLGGGNSEQAQAVGSRDCTSTMDEVHTTVKVKGSDASEGENRSSLLEGGLLESDSPETCKDNYCSNSSEPELLESQIPHDREGDGHDNFEIGTQLNELINLCMEDEVHSNCRASPVEYNTFDSKRLESEYQVQCPLCGSDISDLSEEHRQLHTNNCFDDPAKESNPNHDSKPPAAENVENKRVIEWLRELGLSKYEEIFIKEEIDWETLQWLSEEDLLGMGITSLGPRKKIIHALGEMRKKKDHVNHMEADLLNPEPESAKKTKLPMNGNKLITEYFQCSSSDQIQRRVCKVNKPCNVTEQKNSTAKISLKRIRAVKGKAKETPIWCCVPGTPFRVDAFRYLRGDCCHWFLTHFHLDHYQGLTRSFCHGKIYCSSITASLVHHKIGVPWERLHVLPMNQKITIAGVSLTCFDANHCPGSIIILFEPPNGKVVLHTGDFRFSSEMANNPILQSSHIHTLILDTTYCNPRYDFPSQETVIQFVIESIQAEAFNPKTLFLIGSYTIGKERLFMEVARLLQKKIYVGAAKLQILKHLELPQEIMHWFTAIEAESHIHVVPMWTLASFKRMKFLSNQYAGRFDLIVAFCPTGWAFGKGRKKTPGKRWQQGSIIRYEVPYSEHSSFTELQEFVKFISPEHIVPSVNNDGPESADAMLAQLLNE